MTELRPEVRKFAEAMERKLRQNDNKGGWKYPGALEYLVDRLETECIELKMELDMQSKQIYRPKMLVLREAADVANFAMMIADVCGALGEKE